MINIVPSMGEFNVMQTGTVTQQILLLKEKIIKTEHLLNNHCILQKTLKDVRENYELLVKAKKAIEKDRNDFRKKYCELFKVKDEQTKEIEKLNEKIRRHSEELQKSQLECEKLSGVLKVYQAEKHNYHLNTNCKFEKDRTFLLKICCEMIKNVDDFDKLRSCCQKLSKRFKNDLEKLNLNGTKLKSYIKLDKNLKIDYDEEIDSLDIQPLSSVESGFNENDSIIDGPRSDLCKMGFLEDSNHGENAEILLNHSEDDIFNLNNSKKTNSAKDNLNGFDVPKVQDNLQFNNDLPVNDNIALDSKEDSKHSNYGGNQKKSENLQSNKGICFKKCLENSKKLLTDKLELTSDVTSIESDVSGSKSKMESDAILPVNLGNCLNTYARTSKLKLKNAETKSSDVKTKKTESHSVPTENTYGIRLREDVHLKDTDNDESKVTDSTNLSMPRFDEPPSLDLDFTSIDLDFTSIEYDKSKAISFSDKVKVNSVQKSNETLFSDKEAIKDGDIEESKTKDEKIFTDGKDEEISNIFSEIFSSSKRIISPIKDLTKEGKIISGSDKVKVKKLNDIIQETNESKDTISTILLNRSPERKCVRSSVLGKFMGRKINRESGNKVHRKENLFPKKSWSVNPFKIKKDRKKKSNSCSNVLAKMFRAIFNKDKSHNIGKQLVRLLRNCKGKNTSQDIMKENSWIVEDVPDQSVDNSPEISETVIGRYSLRSNSCEVAQNDASNCTRSSKGKQASESDEGADCLKDNSPESGETVIGRYSLRSNPCKMVQNDALNCARSSKRKRESDSDQDCFPRITFQGENHSYDVAMESFLALNGYPESWTDSHRNKGQDGFQVSKQKKIKLNSESKTEDKDGSDFDLQFNTIEEKLESLTDFDELATSEVSNKENCDYVELDVNRRDLVNKSELRYEKDVEASGISYRQKRIAKSVHKRISRKLLMTSCKSKLKLPEECDQVLDFSEEKEVKFEEEKESDNGDDNLLDSIMTAMTKQAEEFKAPPSKKVISMGMPAVPVQCFLEKNSQLQTYDRHEVNRGAPLVNENVSFKNEWMEPLKPSLKPKLSARNVDNMKKKVRKEIENFLSSFIANSEVATSKTKHCMSELFKFPEEIIASSILTIVLENTDEEVNVFEGAIPPLTPTQHRLIVLITLLKADSRFRNLPQLILKGIRKKFFPDNFFWPDDALETSARFYAALCKRENDASAAWRFCRTALCEMHQRSCIAILTVLRVWPDILHESSLMQRNLLATTMVQLILHTPKSEGLRNSYQERKLVVLKQMLLKFYNFQIDVTLDGYVTKLLNLLLEGVEKAEESLLLISRCRNWDWNSLHLLPKLMEMTKACSEKKFPSFVARKILNVIAGVGLSVSKDDRVAGKVNGLLIFLTDILLSGKMDHPEEESMVEILLTLNPELTLSSILSRWNPRFAVGPRLAAKITDAHKKPATEKCLPKRKQVQSTKKPKFPKRKKKKKSKKKGKKVKNETKIIVSNDFKSPIETST